MRLEHHGIVLRNAQESDAAQLCTWWNDGRVMAHAGFPNGLGTTVEEIKASLREDRDDVRRRLLLEEAGRPIGEMGYRILSDKRAEIGIKICDFSRQEQGIGKVALRLLIGELFQRGCEKIILDTNLNNVRAQHVYERLGFVKTGIQYDSWRDQVGNLQSAVDYELTPERFVNFAANDDK